MQPLIYLDNNATTRMDEGVVVAMQRWYREQFGNPSSLHQAGQTAFAAVIEGREIIAAHLDCEPTELIFTGSGSEANNLAIKGIVEADPQGRRHLITSAIEHPSVLETMRTMERRGYRLTVLPVDAEGFVDLAALDAALTPETSLVSIMHANNEIGTIQPIAEIAARCAAAEVPFHTDAVQSFGKLPLSGRLPGLSALSLSAHKIHGPKGVGCLMVRRGTPIARLIDGGAQEQKRRAGTENVAGIIGLAEAVQHLSAADCERMARFQARLIEELTSWPDVRLNGPRDLRQRVCTNVNIAVRHREGEAMLARLDQQGIAVSTGSACSSRSAKTSPVLLAIDCPVEFIHGNLRISVSKETTDEEITTFMNTFRRLLGEEQSTFRSAEAL